MRDETPGDYIVTPELLKQEIEEEVNYLWELSVIDDDMFVSESNKNAFLIGFGTGFHIFQSMRAEYGNPKMMDVLGNIIGILTNKDFIEAYHGSDKELLNSFWFNFADLTREYFKNVIERLRLLGY